MRTPTIPALAIGSARFPASAFAALTYQAAASAGEQPLCEAPQGGSV